MDGPCYFRLLYAKSTKKAVNPLQCRELTAFQFLGCLPVVYQANFLTSKISFLTNFLRFLHFLSPRKNRDTAVTGRKS